MKNNTHTNTYVKYEFHISAVVKFPLLFSVSVSGLISGWWPSDFVSPQKLSLKNLFIAAEEVSASLVKLLGVPIRYLNFFFKSLMLVQTSNVFVESNINYNGVLLRQHITYSVLLTYPFKIYLLICMYNPSLNS